MGRLSKGLVLFSAMMLLPVALFASVPNAENSTKPDCIRICPAGDMCQEVIVRDQNNEEMPNTPVRMIFNAAANAAIYWCPGQAHPVIEVMTDDTGLATFCVAAGGCYPWAGPDEPPGNDPGCVIIEADPGEIELKSYDDVGSPDMHTDAGPPPNGDGDVDLLDFVVFAQLFDQIHHCADFHDDTPANDGACDEDVDLLDFVVFAQHFNHVCP